MSGRWGVEHVNLAEANMLGDVFRKAEDEAEASLGTMLAAMSLCIFNRCGIGTMARRRGKDVQEEMQWFMATLIETIGELVESRYDHN